MTKQQRSAETRARILSAATGCFAQNGYDATGIAEICEAAGVSKGAFYYHFSSKQAVFLELLNGWMAELEASLEAAASGSTSAPERLARMAQMMRAVFQFENAQAPIFLEFWTQASRDESVRQAAIAPYHRFQEFFADLIRQGIEQGSFQRVDPAAGEQVIISLASGLLLQGALDPQGADWGRVAEDSIQILLEGFKRRV
jgi:AcrR family transcriptional regulator